MGNYAATQLLNFIRGEIQSQLSGLNTTRLGTISSYDPNNHAVKVMIQPDNIESGWMPLGTQWSGNGWGMFAAPSIGDQVKLHGVQGSIQSGVIGLRCFSDSDRPLNVPSGEFWLAHKTGSVLKLHNDGSMEITANGNIPLTVGGNLTANITGNLNATVAGSTTITSTGTFSATAPSFAFTGNVTVNGTLVTTGDITDNSGAHGTLQNIRTTYNSHTHSGGATPLPILS